MSFAGLHGICAGKSIEQVINASVFLDDDDYVLDQERRDDCKLKRDCYYDNYL